MNYTNHDYLAVEKGGNGEIPGGVSGHEEAEEGPHPIIVEGWDEHCRRTARPKYVRPSPLVQVVVYIVYVTETNDNQSSHHLLYIYMYVCIPQLDRSLFS